MHRKQERRPVICTVRAFLNARDCEVEAQLKRYIKAIGVTKGDGWMMKAAVAGE